MDIQEIKDFAAVLAINAAVYAEVASLEGMKAANAAAIFEPPKYTEQDFVSAARNLNTLSRLLNEKAEAS
jgi:hypothetical protein